MLRRILTYLIVPLILFAPQLSCCCLSEIISSKMSPKNVVKSCCEVKAEHSKQKAHQCACDKVSKSNSVEQSKSIYFDSKIIFDEYINDNENTTFLTGLFPSEFSIEEISFYRTIRNDPPRSIYKQYCSYLI